MGTDASTWLNRCRSEMASHPCVDGKIPRKRRIEASKKLKELAKTKTWKCALNDFKEGISRSKVQHMRHMGGHQLLITGDFDQPTQAFISDLLGFRSIWGQKTTAKERQIRCGRRVVYRITKSRKSTYERRNRSISKCEHLARWLTTSNTSGRTRKQRQPCNY